MEFYKTLAPYYDSFFPPGHDTLEFIMRAGMAEPKRAYDAGCATGSTALDLGAAGWTVLGVDLCAPMIDIARQKADRLGLDSVRFECGDMTDSRFVDPDRSWNLVLCLGNTLPHLDADSIARFFRAVKEGMEPGGLFIVQTLNYAHPGIGKGFVFPTLEYGPAVFRRRYSADPAGGLRFETQIEVNGRVHSDRTRLEPVTPTAMKLFLTHAGFSDIGFSGAWTSPEFREDSDRYVITTARA